MDNTFQTPPAHMLANSPFFYYNPESASETTRQHGHFTPHPKGSQGQVQDSVPVFQSNMVYQQRPSSSNSQSPYMLKSAYIPQSMLTPVASPQPMPQKPAILIQAESSPYLHPLDTDCADIRLAPATPPLSCSGSAISSPPSTSDILPTPVHGLPMMGDAVKEGHEEEVFNEILGNGDWPSASPPMTPGKLFTMSAPGRCHEPARTR
jgi:C2H2 transcription facotor